MYHPSKPKSAPAEAPEAAPEAPVPAAADAPVPVAAEAGPAAPVAAQDDEDLSQLRGPEGYVVEVTGPAKGRWRIGRKFGPVPVSIPAPDLTEPQLRALDDDPELHLTMRRIEA